MAVYYKKAVLQGTEVVAQGRRQLVDPHWQRGMSYLKIGWNWILRAITWQLPLDVPCHLSSDPDPQPTFASKRQRERSDEREFTVLKRIPA